MSKINYTKIRENSINTAKSLSNKELFDNFVLYCQPDDHDGCFTKIGEIEYQVYYNELTDRLSTWLKE